MSVRSGLLIRMLVVLALSAPVTIHAQVDEYGVKAAFVRNFVAFVEWPPARLGPSDPLLICVYNDSPITQKLLALNIDAVRGHSVQIKVINAVPDMGACHVVFVPAAESPQLRDIQARFQHSGLLTISEEAVERTGAVINMYVSANKMTFDVDVHAADTGGVRVSSKLLALARRVHGTAGAPGTRGLSWY